MGQMVRNLCFTSFLLLHLMPGRSAPFSTGQADSSNKGRQLTSRINCSDCKQHITNRIRQMQHLERMKQRIISAIRNNGNQVPVVDSSSNSAAKDTETRDGQQNASDQPGKPAEGQAANHSTTVVSTGTRSKGGGRRRTSSERGVKDNPKGKKDSKGAVIETNDSKIISFSRVVSSGRRKHVLQFTLKPASQGEDLEVVKAHLWLLLTRHSSSGDEKGTRTKVIDKGKVKVRKGAKDSNNNGTISSNTGVKGRRRKHNRKKGRRRSRRDLPPEDFSSSEDEKNATDSVSGRPRKPDISGKNADDDDKEDRNADDPEDEEDDDKYKAVLRVMLVADNGTRTLMTYLRTNVKVTHWQKVRLPVSVIQQQLQSSHNTLTLMIRCRRCGGAVRMVLPREARRKARRLRRKERRRSAKERGEKKRKRKRKNRNRRHGVMSLEGLSGTPVRRLKRKFRPLPFLVINTRLRLKKHV